jgi:hypothetical protein
MSFEDIIVRILNRNRRHPQQRKQSSGLHVGDGESLLTRERTPFVLPLSPAHHLFSCGRTGAGKTTLLLKLLYEHLQRGIPFIFVDFHGPATDEILAMLASSSHARPVILLEPWSDRTIGWNQLETHGESPYPMVQEIVSTFHRRLYPDAWGPRLEEVLRMTLLALAQAGLTLLEVTAFLSRPEFRRAALRRCSLPEVREFWTLRFERLSPSQRSLISEAVLNKLSVFQDPTLRYLVGQQHGALDFDAALAKGHIILANLSSGRLRGNSYLLAALLMAAFKNAVYRRPPNAKPFGVILDEFQEMLALEALDDFLRSFRKFNCASYLATQHLALPPELKASIFGNCSRFLCFATSAADAAFLGKEFGSSDGELAATLLPELKTGQAVAKVRGQPVRLVRVSPSPVIATPALVNAGRERCLQLGKSRREIDQEIARRTSELLGASPEQTSKPEVDGAESGDGTNLPEGYE